MGKHSEHNPALERHHHHRTSPCSVDSHPTLTDTSQNLAATLIFTVVTFPLLFMKVHKTRWLWTIKAFVLPPAV